jgi:regulator of cell morphogenesis and NO signaling
MIDPKATLADLAAKGAQTRSVLLQHQLDFCCGGKRSLDSACETGGLELEDVIADLEAANEPAPIEDWASRPATDIIEHILVRYHRPLHQQLEGVIAAAEKVERVHAAKAACPTGLAAHLKTLRNELESHMAKEEQILFPAIQSGRRGPMLGGPVRQMMFEHEHHGANLRRTRELTNDLVPPANACATWRTLYEELERLEADLMAHVHLENNALFPRVLGA